MSEKLRVHTLAQELGVASKDIIAKCDAEGIDTLKNHMSVVSAGLAESIREWFSVGADVTSVEVALPVDLSKVRKQRRRRKGDEGGAAVAEAFEEESATPVELAAEPETVEVPALELPPAPAPTITEPPAVTVVPELEVVPEPMRPAAVAPPTPPAPEAPPAPPVVTPTVAPATPAPRRVAAPPPPPSKPVAPAGPQLVPRPAELKGPQLIRMEAPDRLPTPRPRPMGVPPPMPDRTSTTTPRRKPREGRGTTAEEEARRARSPVRRDDGVELATERLREWRDQDLLERKERLASATGHTLKDRRLDERPTRKGAPPPPPAARRAEVEITAPLTLRDFCAAIGIPYVKLLPKLQEHTGGLMTINQMIDFETAELLAMEFGLAVKMLKRRTALEALEEQFAALARNKLQPRPPVVTMLGHVDHGKTSLLDAIRKTNVAAGEAGGITQHIGAYRIDRGDWHVSFLDTPGHQAFTEMRARGANLTDVVVLVVAANDGVMPQTIEAINHAKAAKVPIIVALNKIDLPGVDLNRVYGQLAEQGLTVSEWGGEVDVIKTSATTGVGIDDLIAHLSTLSELLDLKADPTIPTVGQVIEAQMREGKGVTATVLVREGILRPGQTIVCGPGYGRVRSLHDSAGRRLPEAGPGTPVEVSGLDELPAAGDMLYQVSSAASAKSIAEEVRSQRRDKALSAGTKRMSLEELFRGATADEVPVLNILIKADVQGSLDALRGSLGEIPSDEVRLNILHAGVGAVTEADVRLSQVSSALIIGFCVVAEDGAQRLADEVGVEIRSYRVIYNVIDDIKKALEGLLEPEIRITPCGKVEVLEIFNLPKAGSIAGCRVVDGQVARTNKIRIVRDSRVVRENVDIASLRRFKNDVKEVNAGMECGIRLAGFDDLKIGDVFEIYEVAEVARTL
ncbi:MAG: Elongation factor 4 [Phycisphaerae bacterium]|nr:Elongation factor 4 [Phycisphaerae bacterium]